MSCVCMYMIVCVCHLYVFPICMSCVYTYILLYMLYTIHCVRTCRLEVGGVSLCMSPYILGVQ